MKVPPGSTPGGNWPATPTTKARPRSKFTRILGEHLSDTLRELHDELRTLSKELTEETHRPVFDKETGTLTSHPVPPLLAQLRDAIGASGESGMTGKRGTPVPLDLGAAWMLAEIERKAVQFHTQALAADAIEVEARVRALVAIVGRWTDPNRVAAAVAYLRKWAEGIKGHLDPEKRWHVAAACPACGKRTVRRQNEDGEWVNQPTLQVDGTNGCMCLNPECGHRWPTTHLEHLEHVIRLNEQHDPPARLRSSAEGSVKPVADDA